MANRSAPAAALFQLRARWALCLLFGLLAILTGRIFLAAGWPVGAADDWALLAVFVFFAQLALVWFDLPRNISNKREHANRRNKGGNACWQLGRQQGHPDPHLHPRQWPPPRVCLLLESSA